MDAIGLNPIKLDAIGLDPIRMNAIRLGVPGASSGSGRPYIDPELLSHVKMAISTWGKSNDDPDRAILKDLSGNGNDMRLLNFGFAGNSGYGLYEEYFDRKWVIHSAQAGIIKDSTSVKVVGKLTNKYIVYHTLSVASSVFKIKITGLKYSIEYTYNNSGIKKLIISSDGIYDIPASSAVEGSFSTVGFYFDEKYLDSDWTGFSIEIIPDFEGWLCTDGVDDLIESVKPVPEMLEGSNEITVVSIIHQISFSNTNSDEAYTNNIRDLVTDLNVAQIKVSQTDKCGIYGYTIKNLSVTNLVDKKGETIDNILGDKNDYQLLGSASALTKDSYFSVAGWRSGYHSKVAYAGGFIANKVLTTDEINQIIAYFNLDRPGQIIKPQLYCNIKKQGITNDNHAEFNDQLIDFLGGHNIQLNNIGWEGESGINSYPVVFGDKKTWDVIRANDGIKWNYKSTPNSITIYKVEHPTFFIMYSYARNSTIINEITISEFRAKISGLKEGEKVQYYYISSKNTSDNTILNITTNGTYTFPTSVPIQVTDGTPQVVRLGFLVNLNDNISTEGVKIEVLPTIENALCLDGISDFGKATELPILKDYTVVADREIERTSGGIASKNNPGAFIFETSDKGTNSYSFGALSTTLKTKQERSISYLSKYSYNGSSITAGTDIDTDSMWLGTIRDGDSRFSKLALWSLMLFPYSLSEFLLERQLKKYKAGTLYPDMIEFRPIVKSNIPYLRILYFITSTGNQIIKGSYIPIGSVIQINIQTVNATDEISSVSVNGKEVDMYNKDETYWRYRFNVTKSPQKISIVISSYLTMLGNDTLISNETLIKNE